MGTITDKTVGEFIDKMKRTKPNVKYYVSDGNISYQNPKSEIILNKKAIWYRVHKKSNKFDDNYIYIRFE